MCYPPEPTSWRRFSAGADAYTMKSCGKGGEQVTECPPERTLYSLATYCDDLDSVSQNFTRHDVTMT
jgi:hypothetical protein